MQNHTQCIYFSLETNIHRCFFSWCLCNWIMNVAMLLHLFSIFVSKISFIYWKKHSRTEYTWNKITQNPCNSEIEERRFIPCSDLTVFLFVCFLPGFFNSLRLSWIFSKWNNKSNQTSRPYTGVLKSITVYRASLVPTLWSITSMSQNYCFTVCKMALKCSICKVNRVIYSHKIKHIWRIDTLKCH